MVFSQKTLRSGSTHQRTGTNPGNTWVPTLPASKLTTNSSQLRPLNQTIHQWAGMSTITLSYLVAVDTSLGNILNTALYMSRPITSTSRLAPVVGCLGHLREQIKDPASHITKTTPDQFQDALGAAARDFRT